MAYTRVWDNAAPPGTAPANTLDTIIQAFREDTQQRISSVLKAGTTINDDPLQLAISSIGGGLADRRFNEQPFVNNLLTGACFARIIGVPLIASQIRMPFRVPSGCTLKLFSVQANPTLGGATDVIFTLSTFTSGLTTVVATATFLASGLATVTSAPIAVLLAPSATVWVSVYKSAHFGVVPDVDIYSTSVYLDTTTLETSF